MPWSPWHGLRPMCSSSRANGPEPPPSPGSGARPHLVREVLDAFTNGAPSLGLPPLASASVNVAALATITALFWFVSRALFQGKEVE